MFDCQNHLCKLDTINFIVLYRRCPGDFYSRQPFILLKRVHVKFAADSICIIDMRAYQNIICYKSLSYYIQCPNSSCSNSRVECNGTIYKGSKECLNKKGIKMGIKSQTPNSDTGSIFITLGPIEYGYICIEVVNMPSCCNGSS